MYEPERTDRGSNSLMNFIGMITENIVSGGPTSIIQFKLTYLLWDRPAAQGQSTPGPAIQNFCALQLCVADYSTSSGSMIQLLHHSISQLRVVVPVTL